VSTPGGLVPRRLHQIWLGSPPIPYVQRTWATWDAFMEEHHPDWEVRRWVDDEGGLVHLVHELAEQYHLGPRGAADLLRVMVVSLVGGIYMDSDTVPLLPLTPYADRPGWIGTSEQTRDSRALANASFGFAAADPFLAAVWQHAHDQLAHGIRSDHHVAGPHAWRKVWETSTRPPPIDYSFTNVSDTDLQHTMGKARPFDTDALRERFPGVPVLHVVFSAAREGP
jgi:mannosyltransferase OCH1-like enzyme